MLLVSTDPCITCCREKPLHLNVFTKNEAISHEFIARTSSGGFSANDCMVFRAGTSYRCLWVIDL